MGIYLYAPGDTDSSVQELAELSGIELYQVTLDVEWDTGRRERGVRFNTIRSILANP